MAHQVIEIIRGDDEAIEVTIQDTNGDSLLVIGNKLFLTIKDKFTDADADARFSATVTLSANVDSYTFDLSDTDTDLPLGSYDADVQWINNAGKVKTVWRGKVTVGYDVTNRIT